MTHFTIVIPTRERADTLYWAMKTCLEQNYEQMTLLISDNCSTDKTEDVVKSFNDSRVQYVKTPKRLSMSANWDFALEHVKGGYVNFIGDDDGLVPNSLTIVDEILTSHPVDAITSKDMAIYYWPNYVEKELCGTVFLSQNPTFKFIPTQKYFNQSISTLNSVHLPQVYHGFVKTEILKQQKKKQGNFFNCSSPDIYASVVLGKILSRHIFSNYPLTIHGLSHHSTGVSTKFRHLNDKAANEFWLENPIEYHEDLVKSSSNVIIYSDAIMLARKYFPSLPQLEIKKIISLSIAASTQNSQEETRKEQLDDIRHIAAKSGLTPFAEKLISDASKIILKKKKLTYGLQPLHETLCMKTIGLGINNIYDMFKFSSSLLAAKPYYHTDRPLTEPVTDSLVRVVKTVKRKLLK